MTLEVARRLVCDTGEVCGNYVLIALGETVKSARARAAQLGWSSTTGRSPTDHCPRHVEVRSL